MAAMLAMPTKVPEPRCRMRRRNGWKVAARPVLLVAKVSRMTSRSWRSPLSMPTLMPALAITTSGRPWRSMQATPAATMLSVSATSAA